MVNSHKVLPPPNTITKGTRQDMQRPTATYCSHANRSKRRRTFCCNTSIKRISPIVQAYLKANAALGRHSHDSTNRRHHSSWQCRVVGLHKPRASQ